MEETSEDLPNFSVGIDLLGPDPTSKTKPKKTRKLHLSQICRKTSCRKFGFFFENVFYNTEKDFWQLTPAARNIKKRRVRQLVAQSVEGLEEFEPIKVSNNFTSSWKIELRHWPTAKSRKKNLTSMWRSIYLSSYVHMKTNFEGKPLSSSSDWVHCTRTWSCNSTWTRCWWRERKLHLSDDATCTCCERWRLDFRRGIPWVEDGLTRLGKRDSSANQCSETGEEQAKWDQCLAFNTRGQWKQM